MTLIYFVVGVLLTFWGGYDFAQYKSNPQLSRLFSCIATTTLGILNLIVAAGVL